MTKAKLLKVLRSGAVVSLITSIASATSGLAGLLDGHKAMVLTAIGTFLAVFSKSLPQLVYELLDDNDVILGEGGQSGVGTEVPK